MASLKNFDVIIKYLSKIPPLVLWPLSFVFSFIVFMGAVSFFILYTPLLETTIGSFLLFFLIFLIIPFLIYKGHNRVIDALNVSIANENTNFISNTNMPQLCLDMLWAVQKKYKYTNFNIKLEDYSDWIGFQSSQNRKIPLDSQIKNDDLKHYGTGTFITFDNVYIAQNKFLNSLFHTNIILVLLQEASAIEINLLSDFLIDETYENIQLRIKIIRGTSMFEIRYELDASNKPIFQEIVFIDSLVGLFYEKQASDEQLIGVIKFMQKFIKKTRKLTR